MYSMEVVPSAGESQSFGMGDANFRHEERLALRLMRGLAIESVIPPNK